MSDVPVSIIIPAFNQVHFCRMCVASIQQNTRPPYRLILVNNGSTDDVPAFFDSVPGAVVVHAPENRGFAGGVNLGLREAEGHVLLLNSDTLVPPAWLERLLAAMQSADDWGLIGPCSNRAPGAQQIDGLDLQTPDDIAEVAGSLAGENAGRITETDRLVAFCLLIRDRTLEQVGYFDERFGIGNYEDDDYCLRARRAGFRLGIAEDCFVFHFGGRTFVGMGIHGERFIEQMARNRARFHEKWRAELPERSQEAEAAEDRNRRAREAVAAGDTATAMRLLHEGIRVFPALASNHNDLGVLLWDMGERERGYRLVIQALRHDPFMLEARGNLRDMAEALGRAEEARALLEGEG